MTNAKHSNLHSYVVPQVIPLQHRSAKWLHVFVILCAVCQIGLIIPGAGPLRMPLRSAGFASSILLLFFLYGRGSRHPSSQLFIWIIATVLTGLLHPEQLNLPGAIAHTALYVAILAPLIWVARLRLTLDSLRRLIIILWLFHTAGTVVGVLQTYIPKRFDPDLSQVLRESPLLSEGMKIKLSTGEYVQRPMGLTDTPGGASFSGLYSSIFGVGLLTAHRSGWLRTTAAASMAAGIFCIYLCHIRSILIMGGLSLAVFAFLLARRGELIAFRKLIVYLSAIIAFSTSWAFAVGGENTIDRFRTLIAEDPTAVYARNRGFFLAYTWYVALPDFPLGAGTGRWGMMNYYFKPDKDNTLYAEIQWTGWIYDGGAPLAILYSIALIIAGVVAWRIATDPRAGEVGLWGAVIFSYNMGVFVVTFNYPIFQSQSGMEFWMLNAAIYGAYRLRLSQQPGISDLPSTHSDNFVHT